MYLMQTVSTVPRARPLTVRRSSSMERTGPPPPVELQDSGHRYDFPISPGQPYPPPSRRRGPLEHPPMPDHTEKKKEKKWSLGGLFRRRKKEPDSDSSTAEEEEPPQRKGFLARRRSRREKRKQRVKIVGTFDHVVVNPLSQTQNRVQDINGLPTSAPQNDVGRDVTTASRGSRDSLGGSVDRLSNRSSRESLPQQHKRQDSSLSRNSSGSGSLEGSTNRRGKLDMIKARVEAIRDQQRGSSSDECDGFPASPSLSRFRSDDSLSPTQREGSFNRRSRVARTERYIRRLSRDEEGILKREAEMDSVQRQRLCKSDAEGNFNRTNRNTKGTSGNKLPATTLYQESSDHESRLLTRTPSATPSPAQSPRVRPKPMLQYMSSTPPNDSLTSTFPPSHYHGPTLSKSPQQNSGVRMSVAPRSYAPRGLSPAPSNRSNESIPVHGLSRSRTEYLPSRQNVMNYENIHNKGVSNHGYELHFPGQKSHSYESNIHQSTNYANMNGPSAVSGGDDVLVVQFPIARPQTLQSRSVETTIGRGSSVSPLFFKPGPPPPPPRDPQRRLTSASNQPDPPRPMSYAFENGTPQTARIEYSLNHPTRTMDLNGNIKTFSFVPQPHIIANVPATGSAWTGYQRRSSSDNQIAAQFPQQTQQLRAQVVSVRPRPASVTPEAMRPQPQQHSGQNRVALRTPSEFSGTIKQQDNPQSFQYFADQQPRSRKPIHIQCSNGTGADQPYLSDSQVVMMKPPYQDRRNPTISASEFWRQKDQESSLKQRKSSSTKPPLQHANRSDRSRSNSPRPRENSVSENVRTRSSKFRVAPLTFPVRNTESVSSLSGQSDISSPLQVPKVHSDGSCYDSCDSSGAVTHGIDSLRKKDSSNLRPLSMVLENTESQDQNSQSPINEEVAQALSGTLQPATKTVPPTPPVRRYSRQSSTSSIEASEWMGEDASSVDTQKNKRRSTNLEDALNELEAIYKSLRLGDEDLLDRAERRDLPTAHQQQNENFSQGWVNSRGAESDSGYNYSYGSSYESIFDAEPPVRRQRAPSLRRSGIPDKVMDDMAYRRLHPKERPGSQDIRNVVSQSGSYILASPGLAQSPGATDSAQPQKSSSSMNEEPDVTYDDVVYRTIKHANTTLKILDPQPPFGIPLGPITAAPNSDYLHATPVDRYRPTFKPRKIPDIVKDDLAFRNLRKDSQKDSSSLPASNTDDVGGFTTVTNPTHSNFSLRKKRAVRSLSANLMSFVHREPLSLAVEDKHQEFEKAQSLSDLPDALQVAQKILEGKEVIGGGPVKLRNLTSGTVDTGDTRDVSDSSMESSALDRRYGIVPVSWIERANLDKALGAGTSTSTETLTDSRANLQHQDGVNKRAGWQQKLRVYIPPQSDVIQRPGAPHSPAKKALSSDHSSHEDESLPVPDGVPGSPIDENQLEELLTALAREARATSDRLDLELQQLGEETPNLRLQSALMDNKKLIEAQEEPVADKQEIMLDSNQNSIFKTNLNISLNNETDGEKNKEPGSVVDESQRINFQKNLKSLSERTQRGIVDINQKAIVERHFRSVSESCPKDVHDHIPEKIKSVEDSQVEFNVGGEKETTSCENVKFNDGVTDNKDKTSSESVKVTRLEENEDSGSTTHAEVNIRSGVVMNDSPGNSLDGKQDEGLDNKEKDEGNLETLCSEENDATIVIIKHKLTVDTSKNTDEKISESTEEITEDRGKNEHTANVKDQAHNVFRHIQQLTINISNDAVDSASITQESVAKEGVDSNELNVDTGKTAPEDNETMSEEVTSPVHNSDGATMKQMATIATQTSDGDCECVLESKESIPEQVTKQCDDVEAVVATSASSSVAAAPGEGEAVSSTTCSWYLDPASLLVACSYCIACTHSIVQLDLFAVVGLVLAMISVLAAFIL
ncbi:uncharacterized protein [Anabrus simplex]|uniref:uncharacterized protein isoform X2 n=1 Tax=Anabrus simplex TaxID=316456 RepID=UPI0035A2F3F1